MSVYSLPYHPQVAERLRRIGDEINARVGKELHEATADLLRQQSVFQIGLKQFRGMCRYREAD